LTEVGAGWQVARVQCGVDRPQCQEQPAQLADKTQCCVCGGLWVGLELHLGVPAVSGMYKQSQVLARFTRWRQPFCRSWMSDSARQSVS
jgi:hypothetical protein